MSITATILISGAVQGLELGSEVVIGLYSASISKTPLTQAVVNLTSSDFEFRVDQDFDQGKLSQKSYFYKSDTAKWILMPNHDNPLNRYRIAIDSTALTKSSPLTYEVADLAMRILNTTYSDTVIEFIIKMTAIEIVSEPAVNFIRGRIDSLEGAEQAMRTIEEKMLCKEYNKWRATRRNNIGIDVIRLLLSID